MLIAAAACVGGAASPGLIRIAQGQMLRDVRLGWAVRLLGALGCAALFAVVAARFGFQALTVGYLVLASAGVVLATVDVAEQRLPDRVVLPAAAAIVALLVAGSVAQGRPSAAIGAVVGSAAMFAAYLILALAAPAGIGMGDVKLALAVGAALGCLGAETWGTGVAAGFLLNGVVTVVALLLRRTTLHGSIPLGPSMIAGAFLAVALS